MKNDFEVMKKVFSIGGVEGITFSQITTPRYLVKAGTQEVLIDGKTALSSRENPMVEWALQRIKEGLTTKHLRESFAYIAVDKKSSLKEDQSLNLYFPYEKSEYFGTLTAKNLENHIALSDGSSQSPESIIGLEESKHNRIIFNLIGSEPCSNKKGYDRVKKGKLATVWLNTQSGEWVAERSEFCLKQYPPLAHLKPFEISNEDLIKAMAFVPEEVGA
jgi:hypothetical protein